MRTARHPGSTAVAGLDAVLWLQFTEVDGHVVTCEAHGTRHRRPVDVRLALSTGLALAESGVPALVRPV